MASVYCYKFVTMYIIIALCIIGSIGKQPNFIFILTDDESAYLGDMSVMSSTNKYIIEQGLSFTNAFISTPICCPSRTETIAGRNFQNIRNGNNNCMHVDAKYNVFNNTNSMFQIFQKNGYLTGSFGKLTNQNGGYWCNKNNQTFIDGFSRVNSPCDIGNFYGLQYFDLYTNGSYHIHQITNNTVQASSYQTSQIGNASVQWIEEITTNSAYSDKPFIFWFGAHAPHCPAVPASWYANAFNDSIAPRTPHFNQKVYKHHDFVSTNPNLTDEAIYYIDYLYRDRLRSLLSVDDAVSAIYNKLNELNILDNTYIIYSSDHGFHLGQWRIPFQKHQPYETDMRIPFYIRGPNINANTQSDLVVGNIDLLPTLLDLASIEYDKNVYDGKSWVNILKNNETKNSWNRDLYLSQYASTGTKDFSQNHFWTPADDGSTIPGQTMHAIACNENNEAWMIDDQQKGSWRALRIINDTQNLMYAEFINWEWNDTNLAHPYFHELFDLNADPYQIDNLYDTLANQQQREWHHLMMQYGSCSGTDCW